MEIKEIEIKEIEKKEVNKEYSSLPETKKMVYQNVVEIVSLLLKQRNSSGENRS